MSEIEGSVARRSIHPVRVLTPRRQSRTVRWLTLGAATAAVAGLIAGVTIAVHNTVPSPRTLPGEPKY